ncbi:hypothetical protein ACFFRR_008845 [Megaselia abdita]
MVICHSWRICGDGRWSVYEKPQVQWTLEVATIMCQTMMTRMMMITMMRRRGITVVMIMKVLMLGVNTKIYSIIILMFCFNGRRRTFKLCFFIEIFENSFLSMREWLNDFKPLAVHSVTSLNYGYMKNNYVDQKSSFMVFQNQNDAIYLNDVRTYLNCVEGKLIVRHFQDNGALDNINRCALARLIVYSELGDINFQENYIPKIDNFRFHHLATQITEVFPTEDVSTYFLPYMARGNSSPSGKLYDAYNYVKKKFRKAGVLTPKFRRQKLQIQPLP